MSIHLVYSPSNNSGSFRRIKFFGETIVSPSELKSQYGGYFTALDPLVSVGIDPLKVRCQSI